MKAKNYDIDYDLYSVDEIIKIINFFKLIESAKTKMVDKDILIRKYNEYRNILNNISLEKQYDKMLYEKCGVSIYQTIKKLH
jgi:uncharacterized protein YktA (UPF0223 family)